jgi:preprotein translocase subunit SecA
VQRIRALEPRIRALSDAALQAESSELVTRLRAGDSPRQYVDRSFALVSEASRRTLGLSPHDEQLVAALAMHEGNIAQVDTGEGKTLAAVFTAFLRGAIGRGAHVLTFNDYLARRDAHWMEPIYTMLGVSVAHIEERSTPEERRAAYRSDVTYLTAQQCGFDLLRDGLCLRAADRLHRPFHFALVDEADSILIDEARIPLVIAAEDMHRGELPTRLAALVETLDPASHYETDEYERAVDLTEAGLARVEAALALDLTDTANLPVLSAVNCALHARVLLRRDVDYIVRGDSIKLVDEHTGRVAEDRHWPDGLQAALEAKERLAVRRGGRILGSTTVQHLLSRYPHRCGMTATAVTAASELHRVYETAVVVVPPHRPCARIDHEDRLFTHRAAKEEALLAEIAQLHAADRPVLVGTASVAESERLAAALRDRGIDGEVLNARNDAREAAIIAEAGAPGAVTISTNMAGRGTDIRLGGADEEHRDLVLGGGGLCVLGTNKHESRRIDDQLRGRAGRQGDPGASRFFISLDDPLIARFGVRQLIPKRYLPPPQADSLDQPLVVREVARAQRVIEGQNAEIRGTLSRYASPLETQRSIVDKQRDEVLTGDAATRFFAAVDAEHVARLRDRLGVETTDDLLRRLMLVQIDRAWGDHLAAVADLREGIHLHRVGRQDPLFEFQKQAGLYFRALQQRVEEDAAAAFLAIDPETVDVDAAELKGPSATWTYLINDDPFRDQLAASLAGNMGFSIGAAALWPLLLLWWALKRWQAGRRPPRRTHPG